MVSQTIEMDPRTSNEAPMLSRVVVSLLLFVFTVALVHPAMASPNGLSIKLIQRDSIESPLYPGNLTQEERHRRIVDLSKARALQIGSITTATNLTTNAGLDMIRPIVEAALNSMYIVQLSIGTPPFTSYLLMDTGSDLIWIQCQGCKECFTINGGSFAFDKSHTYKFIPCDHPLCQPKLCNEGVCQYKEEYGGGARTTGMLLGDAFAFSSESIGEIVFGCGMYNTHISFGMSSINKIAGIFGLGGGARSFLSQLGPRSRGRFSYCLQPQNSPQGSHTFLLFGEDAKIAGQGRAVKKTPLLKGKTQTHYYLDLQDISVDRKPLHLNPGYFRLNPDGSGGFGIDSGSGSSFLLNSAYAVVKSKVVEYFLQYKLKTMDGSKVGYDLCYAPPSGFNNFPSIKFHFRGAELEVRDGSFVQFDHFFCLAILPHPKVSVLGANQQTNYRFLYDVAASTLSFAPEKCMGQ